MTNAARNARICVLLALIPAGIRAQRADFVYCTLGGSIPNCTDVSVADFGDFNCDQGLYETFRGRVAWDPLRYTGPVILETRTRFSTADTRHPLFVEVVPLSGRDPTLGYCDGIGHLLQTVTGQPECSPWDVFGPFHLETFGIEIGSLYVVRVNFVGNSGGFQSPYLGCIRVRPAPSTPVAASTWGRVRSLYK